MNSLESNARTAWRRGKGFGARYLTLDEYDMKPSPRGDVYWPSDASRSWVVQLYEAGYPEGSTRPTSYIALVASPFKQSMFPAPPGWWIV